MKIPELSQAAVNYRYFQKKKTTAGSQLQLTAASSSALKFSSWQSINCDFARFGQKKNKKIETYLEYYESLHILYMYFYRGVSKVS